MCFIYVLLFVMKSCGLLLFEIEFKHQDKILHAQTANDFD